MFVKTKITKIDLKKGKPCNGSSCIVARAIKKCLNKNCVSITVISSEYVLTDKNYDDTTIKFSQKISNIIYDYDEGRPVKPQEIIVNIPKKFLKPSLLKGN